MDPRAFIKVSVSGLGIRIPQVSKAARTGIHASSSPCFCEIRLPNFPVQIAPVPLVNATSAPASHRNVAANFYLDECALEKLLLPSCFRPSFPFLEVVVYTGRQGSRCGVKEGNLLGTFSIPVGSSWLEGKPTILHSGWTSIGSANSKEGGQGVELHLNVKVEADPRYIFQFDGQTQRNPQIIQIQGNLRQPIFSCKFSCDRNSRSRPGLGESGAKGWSGVLGSEKDRERKERKGWVVMIHDLSGSPVAAASMVTPFVPSAGTDRVSRSNPGAWLILRPDSTRMDLSWEPWGRLEAWRERGGKGGLGLRFQLCTENGGSSNNILVSESTINYHKGGEFVIDTARFKPAGISPVESPQSSGDCNFNLGLPIGGGFVMSCSVNAEKSSKTPLVQLAMKHVTCTEDAAVFMALAAAVDLSIHACLPFSRRLSKELCTPEH